MTSSKEPNVGSRARWLCGHPVSVIATFWSSIAAFIIKLNALRMIEDPIHYCVHDTDMLIWGLNLRAIQPRVNRSSTSAF